MYREWPCLSQWSTAALDVSVTQGTDSHRMKLSVPVGLQYSNNVQRMVTFVSMVKVLILTAALDVSVTQDTNSHLTELSVSVDLQYSINVKRFVQNFS